MGSAGYTEKFIGYANYQYLELSDVFTKKPYENYYQLGTDFSYDPTLQALLPVHVKKWRSNQISQHVRRMLHVQIMRDK